jgi:protein TonB
LYDFYGSKVLAKGFSGLDFTPDPRIFIVQEHPEGRWGFLDLRAPDQVNYMYNRIVPRPDGRLTGIKNGVEVLLSPTGEELVVEQSPGGLEVPPMEEPKELSLSGFKLVEQMPSFPGGEDAMLKYISDHLKYPVIAKENGVTGMVVIQFFVEKDGSITQAKILRDIGGGCGQEALRLVRTMPKWEPGMSEGEPVRVQFALPVRFVLD